MSIVCRKCQREFDSRRALVGYVTCLPCGEVEAKGIKHCIVPMHKSNYVVITDRRDLMGINNKGGFYR